MTVTIFERRRTGWDIVFGVLLVVGGFAVLGNAVFATAVSVIFIGWLTLISGVVLLVAALFRIKAGGFWSLALGGAIVTVLGLFVLRNPLASALTLTLLAGSMFLAGGLARIVIASQVPEARIPLIVSGAISVLLGLIVLFNLATATLTLLGVLLGVQLLVEGLTLAIVGRTRLVTQEL